MPLTITLLGTGGALSPRGRAQTGILVQKGEQRLLLDCGSGVLMRLDQADVDLVEIDTVLLSHHHLDHLSDLLPLITARWLAGRANTRVYGPEGTEALLGALLKRFEYVRKHVDVEVTEVGSGAHFELKGLKIEALQTEHGEVPARAYKFDGRVVVSGDTRPFPEMARFAEGCELLVHECSFPDGHEIPNHTTPQALGVQLAESGVKRLALTHLYPHTQGREEEMVRSVRAHFPGEIVAARDLMRFEL